MTTHAQCADFPTPLEDFLACLEFIAGGPVFEAKSVSLFGKRLCPAGSGRFRRKWSPISSWVLGFWTVFGGCCPLSVSLTWGTAGAVRRFGSVRLAKPPRSRKRGLRAARAGQQTLRSAPDSRGARGETGAKGHALRGRSHEREQGTEVCSFPNAPPSPVHVRLQSYIAAACASGAWQSPCGGGAALFLSAFAVRRRQGAPESPSCAVARKKTALDLVPCGVRLFGC